MAALSGIGQMASYPKQPATPAAQPAPQTTPPVQPTSPASGAKPAAEPSLDELLGLPAGGKPAGAEGAKPDAPPKAKDAAKAELDRKLGPEEAADEFEEAVKLMDETAKRLTDSKDSGIDTQRMQAQTIEKLDKLIDQAKKQKNKSKSKSKSQQNQDQDQQNQQQQSSQQNQKNQQQQNAAQQAAANAQGGNVGQQSGKLNPPPGAGAAWGQLPQRLRDALMQGSGDYTSAKWEALTREYYKRLAEQPGKAEVPAGGGR
jgi:hypothetical protein